MEFVWLSSASAPEGTGRVVAWSTVGREGLCGNRRQGLIRHNRGHGSRGLGGFRIRLRQRGFQRGSRSGNKIRLDCARSEVLGRRASRFRGRNGKLARHLLKFRCKGFKLALKRRVVDSKRAEVSTLIFICFHEEVVFLLQVDKVSFQGHDVMRCASRGRLGGTVRRRSGISLRGTSHEGRCRGCCA